MSSDSASSASSAPSVSPRGDTLPAGWTALVVALLVAAVAPVLRTLYPILYVIGEDWSYPGVGAVGLVLYLAPLLAAGGAALRPRAGALVGTGLVLAATLALVAADPISRYAAAAATVLALAGATLVALHLSSTGAARPLLLTGVVLGLALDTAMRGVLVTWDLVWRPGTWAGLAACAIPALAVAAAWRAAREDPPARHGSTASRSAVVGLGGLLALSALFLQNPGYVSSLTGWPFWAGVLVVLGADAAALVALTVLPTLVAHRVAVWVTAAAAVVLTALVAVVTGWLSSVVVVLAMIAVVLLAATAYTHPGADGRGRLAGPARAAGAATFALLVVFLWQFYVDTALPFPRWLIAVVPAAVLALGALLAVRRPIDGLGAAVALAPRAAAVAAALALVAVPVALLGAPAPSPAAVAGDRSLTIMTYNIRSAADVDGQIRPDVVAEVIRSYDPDVVVLQETGRGWAIHAGTDVVSALGRELGYATFFMGSADDSFGNVVMSRLPATVVSSGFLPDGGGQRRSYLAVEINVDGSPVLVVNSHLEDRSMPQIEALLDVAGTTEPAVVLGDLNTWPDLPEAAAFTSTGLVDVVAATGDACRTTSAQPTRPCDRPDWILVTPDLAIDEVEIGTVTASDHLPLVARLTLP